MNTTTVNTKKMAANAILIAIGAILHQITPPFGMQADFSLAMLFIIIVFNKEYKTSLACGIIIGVFAALTTKTPGGQIPNIIDKFVTANLIYFIFKVFGNKVNQQMQMIVAAIIGTLISGTVFLGSAYFLVGLPGPFVTLMLVVVLPATVFNAVGCAVLYNAVSLSLKRVRVF